MAFQPRRVTGEVRHRPEAGGRDRRRAGAEAGVEYLEGPGVHDDGQVAPGRRGCSRRPGRRRCGEVPRIVTRYTRTPPAPGMTSPGVAEVRAFACVVSTAVICCGAASPPDVAARLAMAVSIGITGAGTGEPARTGEAALAGETAQPAAAGPDTRARTDASAAAAWAGRRTAPAKQREAPGNDACRRSSGPARVSGLPHDGPQGRSALSSVSWSPAGPGS